MHILHDRLRLEHHGSLSLLEVTISPGGGAVPHLHHDADEILYVLSGVCHVHRGRESTALLTGESAAFPRGMLHGYRAADGTRARLLIVSTPAASRERVFVELSSRVMLADRGAPGASMFTRLAALRGVDFGDFRAE
jgi:quercetin dioxygenase-like cupin family protein